MLHVNAIIKNLAEAHCDRFQNTEQSIEQGRPEVGIMNEVVRNAIDVPGDAHRIDEAEGEHGPKRKNGKKKEHSKEINAMEERGRDGNNVPASEGENPRVGLQPLCRYVFVL